MHYLIDGHNLIAHMPDIGLDDPHGEVDLVLRLRGWAAGNRKRQVTVIFDGGLPGGKSLRLSQGPVKVIFAPAGQPADELLINRLISARNPAEYTLVSSDQEIATAADRRRIRVVSSEKFAGHLRPRRPAEDKPKQPAETADEPAISSAEVAEWLALFGPGPPAQPQTTARSSEKPAAKTRKRKSEAAIESPAELKRGERELEADEIDSWLELFNRPDRDSG
jgi:uncharacterized protein